MYEKDPATVERILKQSTGLAVELLVVGREELAVFQSKQVYPGKGVHVKKSMFGQVWFTAKTINCPYFETCKARFLNTSLHL